MNKKFLSAYLSNGTELTLRFTVLVHDDAATVDALRPVQGFLWTQRESLLGPACVPNGAFSFLPSAV